tara:strand:+ start:119 stop:313 length:195 start_codon:yes stop_codon:yes gene_type:complete
VQVHQILVHLNPLLAEEQIAQLLLVAQPILQQVAAVEFLILLQLVQIVVDLAAVEKMQLQVLEM